MVVDSLAVDSGAVLAAVVTVSWTKSVVVMDEAVSLCDGTVVDDGVNAASSLSDPQLASVSKQSAIAIVLTDRYVIACILCLLSPWVSNVKVTIRSEMTKLR